MKHPSLNYIWINLFDNFFNENIFTKKKRYFFLNLNYIHIFPQFLNSDRFPLFVKETT